MIAVIDYGSGNIGSLINAIKFLDFEAVVTSNAEEIQKADKIIFPGVGNFGNAMKELRKKDLERPIKKA
ncbi:MAG: imidazole glycerol phosphate synthase subunit HisH, partial [Candidatus Diapherotrites archaeon]|nr:imidazole glycerol phosphate synthase subunit HisH [Candidatus Diapherotrites archaeon]